MPETALITETCADCERDLEHCHGTAITHVDGSADCSDDPDCRLDAELHLFVISCAEVDCSCETGTETGAAAQAREHAVAS